MTVEIGYCRNRFNDYLGNVSFGMGNVSFSIRVGIYAIANLWAKIFATTRSPWRHLLVWLIFFSSSIVSTSRNVFATLILAGGLTIALSFLAAVSVSVPRPIRYFTIVAYWLAAGITLSLVLIYGLYLRNIGPLDADAVRAFAQTDLLEAIDYLVVHISWKVVGMAAVVTIFLLITFPLSVSLAELGLSSKRNSVLPAALAAVMVVGGGIPVVAPIYNYVSNYKKELEIFRSVLAKRNIQLPNNTIADFEGTIIVIIGESTARRHMSLYNYFRDTTPLLLARQKELVVFSDVVTPHTHTVPVLTNALTLAGAQREMSFFDNDAIDIISLAKSAGYETFWFSNQNEYGVWDNPISLMAKGADHVRFFSPAVGKVYRRLMFDQEMLPFVAEALSSSRGSRKVVFVHLFATHWPYCDTYPSSFEVFEGTLGEAFFGRAHEPSNLNCYDNAVRYVDWLVDSIIRKSMNNSEPVGLLFFSDHGEAPLLGTRHESKWHSAYQIEVPFLLWVNNAYANLYPEVVDVARYNAERPYSLSRLFHTLGNLMRIESPLIKRKHSIISDDYIEQERFSLDGRITYDEWSSRNDYRENARIFLHKLPTVRSKIWSHRTNTLGALLEAEEVFSGVEMDVVFHSDDNRFHVRHPPAPDTGLTLGDMLAVSFANRPDMRLWFDWKNASETNIEAAIARLDDLDRTFRIKGRALVETDSNAVFGSISSISAAGYVHGYYLPTKQILQCLAACNEDEQGDLSRTLIERIKLGHFSAITYDWRLKEFVRNWLDDFIKEKNLKQFSWDTSINVSEDISQTDEIAARVRNLDALLVVFPSIFKM